MKIFSENKKIMMAIMIGQIV